MNYYILVIRFTRIIVSGLFVDMYRFNVASMLYPFYYRVAEKEAKRWGITDVFNPVYTYTYVHTFKYVQHIIQNMCFINVSRQPLSTIVTTIIIFIWWNSNMYTRTLQCTFHRSLLHHYQYQVIIMFVAVPYCYSYWTLTSYVCEWSFHNILQSLKIPVHKLSWFLFLLKNYFNRIVVYFKNFMFVFQMDTLWIHNTCCYEGMTNYMYIIFKCIMFKCYNVNINFVTLPIIDRSWSHLSWTMKFHIRNVNNENNYE